MLDTGRGDGITRILDGRLDPDDEHLAIEEESSANSEISASASNIDSAAVMASTAGFATTQNLSSTTMAINSTGTVQFWTSMLRRRLKLLFRRRSVARIVSSRSPHNDRRTNCDCSSSSLRHRPCSPHLQNIFRIVVEATTDILGYSHTSLYRRIGELILQYQIG